MRHNLRHFIGKAAALFDKAAAAICKKPTLISLLVIVTAFGFLFSLSSQRIYAIEDSGEIKIIKTSGSTQDAVEAAGITLNPSDKLMTEDYELFSPVVNVSVIRTFDVTVRTGEDSVSVTATEGETVLSVLNKAGLSIRPSDEVSPSAATPLHKSETITITRKDLIYEEVVVSVPYETVYTNVNTLNFGKQQVYVNGSSGSNRLTYQVILKDGVEVSRKLVSTAVLKKPVTRKIYRGTRGSLLLPDGTLLPYKKVIVCNTTAYYANPKYNRTATGTKLRKGVVAVDPKLIPYGTRMYIVQQGGGYVYGYAVAEDTGSSMSGAKIDLYMTTYRESCLFGRRNMLVYILD